MAFAETAQLAVRIDLEGNAAAGIGRLQKQVNGLNTSVGRVGRGFGQVGAGLARAGAIIGTATVGAFAAAAKVGGDFEAQLRTINTIAMETDVGLAVIGDGIRKLAREGRGDLEDLSTGFYDVLSAGITDTTDALGVLDAASKLAIGGLSTNAQAVDLLTTAINAYGQEATAAAGDADLFAKAIEIGKVTADEIAGSFANVAPIAAQTGINIEEVAAAYAALTAQGTPASEVATQMSRAIVELLDPSKDLLALQDKLNVSFLEIAQNDGLVVALQAMRDAVGDDDVAFKNLFGRIEGYKFALQTTGPQQEKYNAALDAMGVSAGTAAAQMAERQQGLNYQLGLLKTNLIDAALEVSAGFLPALTRSLGKLSETLNDPANRAGLRSIGEDIGKAIDGIDWDAVVKGARDFANVLKGTLDITLQILKALNGLPTEIKAAALGFLAVNKLSGGLVGAGLGNIVGGLGEVAARSAGSRLPGVGKLFAQPVFVTNFPPGLGGAGGAAGVAGAGSKLGKVAAVALPVAAIVASVAAVAETYFSQNAASSATAAAVAKTQEVYLRQSPPLAALQNSLAGVDRGIADIKSNPLHMLVQGDALTQLQGMRTDLQAQIARTEALKGAAERTKDDTIAATYRMETRLAEAAQRTKDDTVAASDRVKAATNDNRRHTARGLSIVNSSTRAGSASVVSAIYANRPIVTTTVNVSAASVSKTVTVNRRYGPSGGSRDTGHAPGTGPLP